MEDKVFTPIESQEALDAVLKDRLNRQNEKHAKEIAEINEKYKDYDELKSASSEWEAKFNDLNAKLTEAEETKNGYNAQIADYQAKLKQYEIDSVKTRVAAETGLTLRAIEFLKGETEEEIRASADRLKSIAPPTVAPMAQNNNTTQEDGVLKEFRRLNPNVKI